MVLFDGRGKQSRRKYSGSIFGAKRNHLAQPRTLLQVITDTEPMAILRSDYAGGSPKTSDSESPDHERSTPGPAVLDPFVGIQTSFLFQRNSTPNRPRTPPHNPRALPLRSTPRLL